MLVCEQYPSIHGQRYLVFGSIRVFVSIQSLVPGRLFSSCMELIMAGFGCNVHPESAAASAARAPLINSRLETSPLRVFIFFPPCFHYYSHHASSVARCDPWRTDSKGVSRHYRNPLWLQRQVRAG